MDILLNEFFEVERIEKAIEHANLKGIDSAEVDRLTSPDTLKAWYFSMINGNYFITPPHTQKIPKDNGEFRTVYICENLDRIFLNVVNDLLFEKCKPLVHSKCKSYLKGISCNKVVKELSHSIVDAVPDRNGVVGFKSDLSKYFDSVPIKYIDNLFLKIEEITGKSIILDIVKKFYHQNLVFDDNNKLQEHYMSLGQGVATASFLADALLYDIDERCLL